MSSAITGTPVLSANPTAYDGSSSTRLSEAIQTIWSKEILFQALPILRFEQFMVKKTELSTTPGMTVNFLRYKNLDGAKQLVEGVRMETHSLHAEQITITVSEHGYAIAVTELLLNASFDDVMASGARLLGRNMALYLDGMCRDTLMQAASEIYGYSKWKDGAPVANQLFYAAGEPGTRATVTGNEGSGLKDQYPMTSWAIKDGVETLATKNVPRLGETFVTFVHPHQSRRLRDDPEFIEITKYASPGNFMLGEVGRIHDTVLIETTQVFAGVAGDEQQGGQVPSGNAQSGGFSLPDGKKLKQCYSAIMIGDNAAGHAISLPVELRDGGVLDFGREHALAWYSVFGVGLITDYSVCKILTN